MSVGVCGITVEGRLLLQTLKQDEFEESWRGFFAKHGSFVAGTLFGALVTVGTELIKHWLAV